MTLIETPRLTLRHLTVDDADFIVGLLNQPSFLEFIGDRGVRSAEDARAYIVNGPVASYQRFGFGLLLTSLKDSNIPIGICGLLKRDWLSDVDVGYALLPDHWARGYAFEAAAAVIDHGRRDLGLTRIVGIVRPDNAPSIRVLEKLGMTYERTFRHKPDSPEDKLFAIDFAESQATAVAPPVHTTT